MNRVYASDELVYIRTHFGLDCPSVEELKHFFVRFYKHYNHQKSDIGEFIPNLMCDCGFSRVTVLRIIALQSDFLIQEGVVEPEGQTDGKTRSTTFKTGIIKAYIWLNDYELWDM